MALYCGNMKAYGFTLIVEGTDFLDDDTVDAVFEAGCDDATVGVSNGIPCADFDREAPSIEEAALSAIADIESVDGIEVVRIADAGLLSIAEIAARTGRTRESVRLLVEGKRGPGGFPPPVTDPTRRHRLYYWPEVARWFESTGVGRAASDQEEILAAINAWLELRRLRKTVGPERWEALRARVAETLS